MNASQQHIANHFSTLWKKPVSRHCIGDTLMNAEKWINTNDLHSNVKRIKTTKLEDLEDALYIWIKQMIAKNATITRDIIRKLANIFGQKVNITFFECRSSYLNKSIKQ